MALALQLLLQSATALLLPTPPTAPIIRAVSAAEAVPAGSSFVSPFPPASASMLLAETMSPAKAKIEAAKLAQQEKLAQRGYGELAPAKQAKAAVVEKYVPKSFAEAMERAVAQRENITGRLTDSDYTALEKKVHAAYPGLQ